MDELDLGSFDAAFRTKTDALRHVYARLASDPSGRVGDIPSGEETREWLGLFARLGSEDLRHAVLSLVRVLVEPPV